MFEEKVSFGTLCFYKGVKVLLLYNSSENRFWNLIVLQRCKGGTVIAMKVTKVWNLMLLQRRKENVKILRKIICQR